MDVTRLDGALQRQYHERIVSLLDERRYEAAREVYDVMRAEGIKPWSHTRVELTVRADTVENSLFMLSEMENSADCPSVDVYNVVLNRCAYFKLEYTARKVLRRMFAVDVMPDEESYCSVIRAIGASGFHFVGGYS